MYFFTLDKLICVRCLLVSECYICIYIGLDSITLSNSHSHDIHYRFSANMLHNIGQFDFWTQRRKQTDVCSRQGLSCLTTLQKLNNVCYSLHTFLLRVQAINVRFSSIMMEATADLKGRLNYYQGTNNYSGKQRLS